jgi:hypothetical protein
VVALITKRNEPERLTARQEETRASKGIGEAVSGLRAKARDTGQTLADRVSAGTQLGADDGATPEAARVRKRRLPRRWRPSRDADTATATSTAPVKQEGEVPARVVAVVSAAVAVAVGYLTSRIQKR